jgi:diguanylate cyclase (GGDEF)-like protein
VPGNDNNPIKQAEPFGPPGDLPPPSTPAFDAPTFGAPDVGMGPAMTSTSDDDLPGEIDELLDADGSVVIVLDRDGAIRRVNPVALRVLGASSTAQLIEGTPALAMLRSLLDHVPQHLLHSTEHGTWQGDFDHTDLTGRAQVFRATVAVRPDEEHGDQARVDGQVIDGYIAVIAHEVTAARAETERLRHRSSHDPLTGLSNRRQVLSVLENAVSQQRGSHGHVAALFIDLDRLKYVNDALGHAVGDRLLVSTAARLAETVRPNDHVARIGGDEFLVVCTEMPDTVTALELSDRIRQALSGRLRVRELDLEFSVSVGIALSDADTLALNDEAASSALISNADTAMYEAKRTGRGRSVLFTSQMRAAARQRSELAAALAQAVARDELTIEYQPVFSAVTRRASATEALVRWNHPVRGRIDPATFVAVAEESGSIGRLGESVLRMCLADLRRWIDSRWVGDDFTVHVNVSQVQLSSSSFVQQVQTILREHGVGPHRLVLEARESALLSGNTDVQRSVRTLRRLGIGIAVDNFGTGASALSVLTDIGADYLKLDGSLALPSGSSDADIRLVRALVLLAHALDMQVVAERVSGHEQLRHLQAAGCDFVQGHLLGMPRPNDGHHPAPRWPQS